MENVQAVDAVSEEQVARKRGRLHGLDFTRGVACLSMPIYHTIYNLFVVGLVANQWAKATFWEIWQVTGLSTFVLVSGMAFTLSTQNGIRWHRLMRRALKLGAVALGITVVTYLAMPERFVRFGVIHFFATTIVLAPLMRPMKHWLLLPGIAVVGFGVWMPHSGLFAEPALYMTGLMSDRPRSMDYIPLIPWFGVFLIGMALANFLRLPERDAPPQKWMRPVIWLGKHSLAFYLIHQLVVFGVLWSIAYLLR